MQRQRGRVVDLEMGGARHAVELVQVIGQYARGQPALRQRGQRVRGIVDALEQHRLVEQDGAGIAQRPHGRVHARVEFVGVVGVDHHDHRPRQRAQPLAQLGVHPLGQHDRQAGMDAQAPYMGNGAQGLGEFGELGGGQRQRIAARQQYLLDRGVRADHLERRGPAARRGGLLGIREVTAKAIAAVHGATAGGHQQGTAPVLVDHALAGFRRAVADRVQAETGHGAHLLVEREDLAQQRILWIAAAHARDEAARHPQRELGGRRVRHSQREFMQAEQREQFTRVAHGLAPGLLPAPRLHGKRGCGYHVRLNPKSRPRVSRPGTPHCSRRRTRPSRSERWPVMA